MRGEAARDGSEGGRKEGNEKVLYPTDRMQLFDISVSDRDIKRSYLFYGAHGC